MQVWNVVIFKTGCETFLLFLFLFFFQNIFKTLKFFIKQRTVLKSSYWKLLCLLSQSLCGSPLACKCFMCATPEAFSQQALQTLLLPSHRDGAQNPSPQNSLPYCLCQHHSYVVPQMQLGEARSQFRVVWCQYCRVLRASFIGQQELSCLNIMWFSLTSGCCWSCW